MRWKVGNINFASGFIRIAGNDQQLCVFDNGTSVCDAGFTINIPGSCVSQSVGTVNSNGICISSYVDRTNTYGQLILDSSTSSGFSRSISFGGSTGYVPDILASGTTDYSEWVIVKSLTKDFTYSVQVWDDELESGYSQILDTDYRIGTFDTLRRRSGWLGHPQNAYSESFALDSYGRGLVHHDTYFTSAIIRDTKVITESSPFGFNHEITTVISGSDSVCVGDNIAPSLENVFPEAGSHFNKITSNISFDIVDAIGGVDISSVYVTVSGVSTVQPEGYEIVTAGSPVAQASVVGTSSRYTITYNPSSDWTPNEIIYVTVTGTDNVPNGPDDNPFSCYEGDPNAFGYTWSFKNEVTYDLTSSITAVADSSPPYVTNVTPSPWIGGANATQDIEFDILDDHAGVDLSSLNIYINGLLVVQGGVESSLVVLTPTTGGYHFSYNNNSGFSYGSRVLVRVVVQDLYAISPNQLDYSYFYDVIGSDSLVIENFYPEVGVTLDPDLVDISVDIIDEVYDVDEGGLYLSINGEVCSSTISDLYGLRYLTTTVSGLTAISGTTISGGVATGFSITGTTVAGSVLTGGTITGGCFSAGTISDFPDPFSLTISGTIVNGCATEGALSSAILDTTLINGVNWDGQFTDSTITNVDVHTLYSTGTTTTGTIISGTVGRHLVYHPANDFDTQGAINVLVHATSLNSVAPATIEYLYQLFHGYNVKVYDREFNHKKRINVYIGANNTESFKNRLDYGYYFTTIDQPSKDLTATIVGIAPWEDLYADISPQAPVHRYGETVEIEIYVEDFEGNALGPFTFSYTIEEAPG